MTMTKMTKQITSKDGFIAALDQSGGSTPKTLMNYGLDNKAYKNDTEMFNLVHEMRSRIIKSPAFGNGKILGAILFERTMDSDIDGTPTAKFLWEKRGVVPFLKIDKGLDVEDQGVQLMKPNPGLDALCEKAVSKGIFGTKMRSTINSANRDGIALNVAQQFETGLQILKHGLTPIIEPEVNITISDKADAENILRDNLVKHVNALPANAKIILKLSLPEETNLYKQFVSHPNVMRVVALSGGYPREEANNRLSKNTGMIASFSRALTEGLTAQQNDHDFDAKLADTIDCIFDASRCG